MQMFTLVIGMTVLVLSRIDLRPCGPLQKGEVGTITDLTDDHLFIKFHTIHWDWPSQWQNELMIYLDNHEVLSQLKFSMAGLAITLPDIAQSAALMLS